MNDKCFGLAKNLARLFACRRVMQLGIVTFLGFSAATQFGWPARATDFKRGPLVQISGLSPFRDCTLVSAGNPGVFPGVLFPDDAGAETFVAVNPANAKNLVATWIPGGGKGRLVCASLDGGRRWQQVVVPGLTLCTGGTLQRVWDPWIAFAPNGVLYETGVSFSGGGSGDFKAINVSKSADGGLHWSSPTLLEASSDPRFAVDKPSVTTDPTDARYAYATWDQIANGNRDFMKFSRTTDGGNTWEPARVVFDPGESDQVNDPTILVSPTGMVFAFFVVLPFANANGGSQKDGILTLIRSEDKGLTWSAAIPVARVPATTVTDPDTGGAVGTLGSFPQFFSVTVDAQSCQLHAVWEDTRFSGGQFTGVAFTTSADGGLTWSTPIAVSQTPATVAPVNRNAFLPSVAVAADGTIGVTYYDFRFNDSGLGALTDYWLVHCHPSSPTACTDASNWRSETRLTDASFDLEKSVMVSYSLWLGDYEGLATAGNDFVAVWAMPSGADPNRIFFRRVGP